MDISPDGQRMIVTTYGDAFEFTRRPTQSWDEAFKTPPRRIPLPTRRQGEAICYNRDGKSLCLTSEKRPAPVIIVPAVAPDREQANSSSDGSEAAITTRPVPLPPGQKSEARNPKSDASAPRKDTNSKQQ